MRYLGDNEIPFPESSQDAWEPIVRVRALAMKVLAVANTRYEGAWCAYIDSVPGEHHGFEFDEVLRTGEKLDEQVALVLFPEFKGVPYAL